MSLILATFFSFKNIFVKVFESTFQRCFRIRLKIRWSVKPFSLGSFKLIIRFVLSLAKGFVI